ncbi:terminase large subunit [Niveispirillum sp. KHB5.9]|uniref:terminase large subunit n=1 Tax=Niveispirillum sp. KHB5.9 TaxID=3400269 RepID=UPI003A83EE1D
MGRADRVIRFIENLTITSGEHAGRPFLLRDWQKDIIRGIYDPAEPDGRRRVRTALLTMGRKNGKTQLAAGLVLAHLIGPERESRGQIYSAAADRAQAAIIFNEAKAMLEADPELLALVNIIDSTKRIVHYATGSFFQALSSDSKSKHGFSASVIIYDELAQAPNRELYDVLTTSTAARREPLTLVISTQSSNPNHIMSELVTYGRQVQDGVIEDPTFAPFIFAAPLEADPWDEESWYLANPALGDFRSLEEMRQYASRARRMPALEASFRALYLNQPVDAVQRFIASADWDACKATVEWEALRGRRCWGGLDLSSTRDLTSLQLVFPDDGGGLDILSFFWLPGDGLEDREHSDRVPYQLWRDKGYLEATAGRAIDKRAVAFRLAEIAAAFDVRGIAYDRWRIEDLKRILEDEGIDLPLVGWGQGFKDMGPAVDALETAILSGALRHSGNPILTWNVANAAIQLDPAGARKVAKDKATARVDGLVALVMAVGLYSREPEKEEPGIEVLFF